MRKTLLSALYAFSLMCGAMCPGVANADNESPTLCFTKEVKEDASYDVWKKVSSVSGLSDKTITFEQGVYNFFPEHAKEEFCYISNHNDVLARIAFCLENARNITIDGHGSTFIFHGTMIPFVLKNCHNVTFKNITIDFAESFHSEGVIVANDKQAGTFDMSISAEYPYEIRNGQLIFLKSYYEHDMGQSILYDAKTRAIAFQTENYTPVTTMRSVKVSNIESPFVYKYKTDKNSSFLKSRGREAALTVKQLSPGLVRVYNHRKQLPPVGTVLVCKGEQGTNRFAPAFKVTDSEDVTTENVTVCHAGGMGFLYENCKNVTLQSCAVKTSGNRYVSTTADASHFVGCRGNVTLRNCNFQSQLDDAMNVHGAYKEVVDIIDRHTLGIRVGHYQQLGFMLAESQDTVGVVRLSDSFNPYAKLTVRKNSFVNGRYQIITFNEEIPANIKAGDMLENISAYPEVLVENCVFKGNRARGLLISTPKKTVIRNNFFSTEMEALLLPVESSVWFESGNACNVTIEGNTFQDCTAGGMNRGVICFKTDDESKQIAFNNIVIRNNIFNQFDNRILDIRNVDNLVFEHNTISNSGTFPQQFPDDAVVLMQHSKNIRFNKNVYKGKAKQMIQYLDNETEKVKFK